MWVRVLFYRVGGVALPCFSSSPTWTNQTLALPVRIFAFGFGSTTKMSLAQSFENTVSNICHTFKYPGFSHDKFMNNDIEICSVVPSMCSMVSLKITSVG